jgi:hypothetical protein
VLHARAARGVLVGELRDVLLVGVPSVSTLFYKGCPGIKTERNAQRYLDTEDARDNKLRGI